MNEIISDLRVRWRFRLGIVTLIKIRGFFGVFVEIDGCRDGGVGRGYCY